MNKLTDGTIISNLHSFHNMVYAENLDLIAVTETWLKPTISDKEVLPHSYHVIRKDRALEKPGAGVLLPLRNDIQYSQLINEPWSELEIVAVELLHNADNKYLVAVCFVPRFAIL